MTMNIPNWFIKKYEDTVTHRSQQRTPRLADTVAGGGMFIGDSVFFPRMGAAEAYDSARLAVLALANADMDMIEVKAKPKFLAFGIWDPDKNKLNESVATEYGIAAVNGIMRAEDRMIADALNTAGTVGITNTVGAVETITTIGDYNTVADLDTIAAGIAALGAQYMVDGMDITYAAPFKLKTNMSLDPYMAKSDMKNNLPWNDLTWRSFEGFNNQDGLPLDKHPESTGVDTYLYCRTALASAYNNEKTPITERLGERLADMIGQWFQAGAVAKEPKGIIRIRSKYNFALSRKAVPITQVV